jgi:hypothetical protein
MRRWSVLAVGGAVLAALASCADPAPPPEMRTLPLTDPAPPGGAQHGEDPTAGLRKWADFPVTATPRPLVLVGPQVIDPAGGFRSGEDKEAYGNGAIDFPASWAMAPAEAGGYKIVSAGLAARPLAPAAKVGGSAPGRLRVTAVRLGTARFTTDRGELSLPAWLFSFDRVADPATVLAIDPSERFTSPTGGAASPGAGAAKMSADGRTLTVSYIGGQPGTGGCAGDQTAAAVETRTAVAVVFTPVPTPPDPSGYACPAIGVIRTTTVTLARPLGPRVLITPAGDPYPVVPA